ncbi:hypothetical protein PUNSTDRAFT_74287 [Punctularia strigosozonata HHB-11173 SS5]|uniref:uncharacterized protein n=1 Tax=Punctularia strigosozonata (strain HHB-11173) TaxID=741275 RepID=UPI000441736E|nr:uncharacterized protein PUNSTDRAFT_74287 [Punctularia strigosozonata HHB-11173 SS5]EIN05928.1 hypothetical protein PUNSTDRAFT_74287 [Punctularia strigosozonata HHB-11173 SS5]
MISPRAYVLHNRVTHARLLPQTATHAFRYPTLSLLLSLDALESGQLDLARGWIFGYGSLWGRLTGLRPQGYLTAVAPGSTGLSINEKLVLLLTSRGYADAKNRVHDVWLQTMPGFLGIEGINPLSVYYCYTPAGELWLVVLEVHNTFGEAHVYLLELGKGEEKPRRGFDHQWTFPRRFHVSPFNDRSGFYTVSLNAPSHPPSPNGQIDVVKPPLPVVRVDFRLPSDTVDGSAPHDNEKAGALKLTATIRPTSAIPLTVSSLLSAILGAPLGLLLSMPRILYQAWILHYRKGLDVYARPEPYPVQPLLLEGDCMKSPASSLLGGGVGWQPEGPLEAYTRRRIEGFLRRRARDTNTVVSLISANPAVPPLTFGAENESSSHLLIHYMSPRFFSTLFLMPSAAHALLTASDQAQSKIDRIFWTSDRALFLRVFHNPSSPSRTLAQRFRLRPVPPVVLTSPGLPIPPRHPLDPDARVHALIKSARTFSDLTVLALLMFAELLEKWIFTLVKARFVPGEEPWGRWSRAEAGLGANTKT